MPFDGPLPSIDLRADFWSLRFVDEQCEIYAVRKNLPLPYSAVSDGGVMATVYVDGGYGYAATGDRSAGGMRQALERAAPGLARRRPSRFSTRTHCPAGARAASTYRPPSPSRPSAPRVV